MALIPRAGQQREGHQSAVPALNLVPAAASSRLLPDLLQGRRLLFPMGRGDPRVLIGQIEILGIGILNA